MLLLLEESQGTNDRASYDFLGFHSGVMKAFALLRCYAQWVGSRSPTFGGSLSVPSSRSRVSSSVFPVSAPVVITLSFPLWLWLT
jgi:hypothetical protein